MVEKSTIYKVLQYISALLEIIYEQTSGLCADVAS